MIERYVFEERLSDGTYQEVGPTVNDIKLAREIASKNGWRLIAHQYEFADSDLVQDYSVEGNQDTCADPIKVTCNGCGRSWCERCDAAHGPLCHWCHGRGHSIAEIKTQEDE